MEKQTCIPPAVLAAAATILRQYAPELTERSLSAAIVRQKNHPETDAHIQRKLTRCECAELLGVSVNSVNRYIKNGKLKAVKIVKLAWEKDPQTGRMNSKEVAGSEKIMDCELVLIAAGFLGAQKYVTDAFKVELTPRTNVKTEQDSFKTNVKNVFVAGDMHTGQSLVVKAIRQGRECAREVDESLMGYSNLYVQ